jgi:hypothetical protein
MQTQWDEHLWEGMPGGGTWVRHSSACGSRNVAPLMSERAATRGRGAMESGDQRSV